MQWKGRWSPHLFSYKSFFFNVYHFKVFIEFVKIFPLFYVLLFFDPEACGILAPKRGIESMSLALEGGILTT